jgi:hypothetical protein
MPSEGRVERYGSRPARSSGAAHSLVSLEHRHRFISLIVRANAYVLAGDPTFLAASVQSYYDAVDRIVVSYDKSHLSWSGEAIPVDACLRELREVDPKGKLDLQSGAYSHPGVSGMECETSQRRAALASASEGADWVLQLDSDEVIPDLSVFMEMLSRTDAASASGLDFPSRWIYARTLDGRFLEGCSRWWRAAAGYPGPLAVRAGALLKHARQCEGPLFRVDFRKRNTDPWRGRDTPVHATVPVHAGVLHFSWVRTAEEMATKAKISGHRDAVDWQAGIRRWRRHQRHPRIATALTPLRRRGLLHPTWLRLVDLPVDPPQHVLPDAPVEPEIAFAKG